MHPFRLAALLCACLVLTACGPIVPATVPAQLSQTPGPPVTITRDSYESTSFQARYAAGWQVITSPAFAETWVVFVHPSETAVIVLALDPDDAEVTPPQATDDARRIVQTVAVDDATNVTAAMTAPASEWSRFETVFNYMVESVAPPDDTTTP